MNSSSFYADEELSNFLHDSKTISPDTNFQNSNIKKKYEELNKKYNELQSLHDSEMLRLENSIKSIHMKHNEQLNVLNSTISSLKESLERLRNENTELKNSFTGSQTNLSLINFSFSDDVSYKLRSVQLENKRISSELENQIEYNNILQEKVNKIPDYEALLQQSKDEIRKLKERNERKKACDQNNEDEIKFYKKQNKDLQNKCNEQETKITELQTSLNELTCDLSQVKSELSLKESEISQLLCKDISPIQDQNQLKDEGYTNEKVFTQTLEIFDNFSNDLKNQISELTKQRDNLFEILKKYEKVESILDGDLERTLAENSVLENKLEEVQNQLEDEIQSSQAKMNDLMGSLSSNFEYNFDPGKTPYENICNLIEDKMHIVQDSESEASNNEREKLILGQLENAIRFIRSLIGLSTSNNKNLFDPEERTLILTQCVRISRFIEQEIGNVNVPAVSSLFDPLSVESNAKLFFEFLDNEEDIDESPIHELYVMFLACIEVNFMLFNRNKELLEQKPNHTIKIDDNFRELYEEQLMELKAAEEKLSHYVSNSDNNFFSMLNSFISIYEDLLRHDEQNNEVIDQLRNELYTLSQSHQTLSNTSDETSLLDQKSIVSKIQKLIFKNKKLKEDLNKAIQEKNQLQNSHNQQTIVDENNPQANHQSDEIIRKKYLVLKRTFTKMKKEFNSNKTKMDELTKENEILIKEKNQIQNSSNSLVSDLKEKEQNVRNKNLILSQRISELERTNNETLSNLRKKSENVQIKYNDRIHTLDKELKETREKLISSLGEVKRLKSEMMSNQMEITKMKLELKNKNYLLEQLNSQLKQKEDHYNIKSKAEIFQHQVEYNNTISTLTKAIDEAKQKLSEILLCKFNKQIKSTDSLDKIINLFNNLINENLVAELNSLNLDQNSSILDVIHEMQNEIDMKQKAIDDLTSKNNEKNKENIALSDRNHVLENAQVDLNSWITWARSMHRNIAEGQTAPNSTADLMCSLEESLLAAIGHRKLLRRLEILRFEKKVLCSNVIRRRIEKEIPNKITSIRPLILFLICSKRLRAYGGCLSSVFKFASNMENTTSTMLDDY